VKFVRPVMMFLLAVVLLGTPASRAAGAQEGQERTVRARVQPRPGAPAEMMGMAVHEVPVDPDSVSAAEAELTDDELILGVVIDGLPMAYPIRYLAAVEVVNDVVGDTSLAPTW